MITLNKNITDFSGEIYEFLTSHEAYVSRVEKGDRFIF